MQWFNSMLPFRVLADAYLFYHHFSMGSRTRGYLISRLPDGLLSDEQWDVRREPTRVFHALLYREPFTPYVTNQKTHGSSFKADSSQCWRTVFLHVRVDYCFDGFVFEPQCLFYKILQRIVCHRPYLLAEPVAKHQDASGGNGQQLGNFLVVLL